MAFKTSTTKISNNDFKKMVMKATHKHYISHEVKTEMAKMHKQAILHSENKHVYKHEAVEIMHHLHEAGLAHHMMTDANTFVHREIRKDIALDKNREKQLKEQHLKEIADQKAEEAKKEQAAADKKANKTVKKPGTTPHLAAQTSGNVEHHASQQSSSNHPPQIGHVSTGALTGAQWHTHEASQAQYDRAQAENEHHKSSPFASSEASEESIDLAID